MYDQLWNALFPDDGENSYGIIDGASCEELLDKIAEFQLEHCCLYAGEVEPDVAEVAPYLVELLPDHPFTEWLLANGPGKHWGIFARSSADLRTLRKHFRTFLIVLDPAGKQIYFRYYDPRVLRAYLPTCEPGEVHYLFGPVSCYITENQESSLAIRWGYAAGELTSWQLTLEN